MPSGDFVQATDFASGNMQAIVVTLDSAPTSGNLLVMAVQAVAASQSTPDGWTAANPFVADQDGHTFGLYYRVAMLGDSATWNINMGGGTVNGALAAIAEFEGPLTFVLADEDEDVNDYAGVPHDVSCEFGTVDATGRTRPLVVGGGIAGDGHGGTFSPTVINGTEIGHNAASGPSENMMAWGYDTDASGSVSMSWEDSVPAGITHGTAGILALFEGEAAPTPPPGPPVIEISDSTDTLIATFSGDEIVDWKIRDELEGTGAGSFTIRRDHPDATETNLKTGNVVRVTIPRIDPDPIFAFIIGPKTAHVISKDEEGGETITVIGDGILSYLRREIIWHNSWELGFMTDPPAGGVIKTAATGTKPGQLLNRLVAEAQRAERPLGAIPLVTRDFDYDVDSDGLTWASATQTTELLGYVGDNLLDDLCGRLLGTGVITIRMGPDFDLHAYNTYGRDLTSLTFATGKVRFVRGVNIADALKRETEAEIPPNGALVVGEDDTYTVGEIVTGYPDRTIFIKTQGTDTTALEANAEGELTRMLSRHESLPFKLAIGKPGTEDELTGKYLPGPPDSANGHFWVGDEVTIHTGTGNFDLNNHTAVVQAITLSGDKADNLEAIVEPGAVIKIGPRSSPRASGRGVQPAGGAGGSLPTGTPPPTGDAVLLSGHQADTSDAHDASAISVLDTAAHFTGTDVETVLDEIADSHDAHVADASDAHDASAISVADAGGNFTADNVEDVLAELAAASGGVTVEDEGTPLATTATTLDFVGAGVTATGAGAEKTITIPGDAAHVADTTDAHDASAISVTPTGGLVATDVQAALAELDGDIAAGGIPATIFDAKGDIIVASAADTAARLAVGADGTFLEANAASTNGVRWGTPGGGGYTPVEVPTLVQGVGSAALNTQNPAITIAAAADGNTLILGVNLVGRASTSVVCTNVTWTKVAGPTTSAGGSRYETWVGVVSGGASGTTVTVNTGSSNFASLVLIEIDATITVSAGTPYDADFVSTNYFGPLNDPTAGKLVVMMAGADNTTTGIRMYPSMAMALYSRVASGTGIAIGCAYGNGDDVTGIISAFSGTICHAQIVTVT